MRIPRVNELSTEKLIFFLSAPKLGLGAGD